MSTIVELDIPQGLFQKGIKRIAKEGRTICIDLHGQHQVRSTIYKNDISKTISAFEKRAKGFIDDKLTKQSVISVISENWFQMFDTCKNIYKDSNTMSKNDLNMKSSEYAVTLKELNSTITDKDYSEFVIKTIKKTVKCEDVLIRQTVYTALSAYTPEPNNLGVICPTSEGKSYTITESMNLFPKEDVWYIGSMSTMALVRQRGVLVDSNNRPIEEEVKELKKAMKECHDEEEKVELQEQLRKLYNESKTLIDISGKILVFLEPPHRESWNTLKPILSHDTQEIEFPYVDRNDFEGFYTKKVVVRGWPACFFCTARDESGWDIWPEIVSRFLITSTNTDPRKYQESNLLIAQRRGLPGSLQQQVIVSDEEIELARKCVYYIKEQLVAVTKESNQNNPVWIPFGQILGEILPASRGVDMRIAKRIFSLLNIIPLVKAHLRQKLVYTQETAIIASLNDLNEVLALTQNLNGIPLYKMRFFNEIFFPLYQSKTDMDVNSDGTKKENIIAVTTKQLSEYYRQQTGKLLNSDNLKKTYLNELLNNGIIEEEDSITDKRQKIYYPLVEPDQEKISKYRNVEQFDNLLHYSPMNLPRNCKEIPDNWLIYEILTLAKYRVDLNSVKGCIADFLNENEELKFLDNEGNRLTIKKFISEYEKDALLTRYFVKHKFSNYSSNIFGNMKYLEETEARMQKKLSNLDNFM